MIRISISKLMRRLAPLALKTRRMKALIIMKGKLERAEGLSTKTSTMMTKSTSCSRTSSTDRAAKKNSNTSRERVTLSDSQVTKALETFYKISLR